MNNAPNQLDIFSQLHSTESLSNPEPAHNNDYYDSLMTQLDELNKMGDAMNATLKGMIDEIQKDWDDDTKMMVNNPKEYHKQQKLNKEPDMPKELTTEAIETLKNSKVDGMVVKLPEGQLDRKIYIEVKNKLELIGGKWKGGKVSGFVFQENPADLLSQIVSGENRNIKKEFQFFGTPDTLADYLVELAEINDTHQILEPSAGRGAIVNAIYRAANPGIISTFELMSLNREFLNKIIGCMNCGTDFLTQCDRKFDRIIANPPFNKNQDIDHIRKMYECLKPGGRLVSIASKHWEYSSNKKEVAFKKWLNEVRATIEQVPAGSFKESGTSIATCIIIIDKL